MKQVKSLTLMFLVFLMLCTSHVFAYDYPNAFWAIDEQYVAALESNDYPNIIKYGTEELKLLKPTENSFEKYNTMATRYVSIGDAYAALQDYDNAYLIFDELYGFLKEHKDNSRFNSVKYDLEKEAYAKAKQYQSTLSLYTGNGSYVYYGAVNEKENGVLFGLCSNGETRSQTSHESMVLTYQEFGEPLLSYNVQVIKSAAASGKAVEFALNCPNEGDDIRNFQQLKSSLNEISDLFSKYPDTPIYLRFAAEFDRWDNLADAESFKKVFRTVSEYFKSRNDNVAMVWSPNHVSSWTVADLDDYYPGDSYVDWVGISLYAQKYFQGDRNADEINEIVFQSGANSDPVIAVRDIVLQYGDRKPIMISEFGCGHKLMKNGKEVLEDTGDFALRRLKEYMNYLPMVYPQIKLMAYFDWYVSSPAETSDYRLSNNPEMQNEYLRLTKTPRFIQDRYSDETDFCYRKITDGTQVNSVFPVSCYAHRYQTDLKRVTYYLDGRYMGMSDEIPYTAYLDASGFSGKHTLKALAEFSDGTSMTQQQTVNIENTNSNITVELSGERMVFDQNPILYCNRTMVPMRKIFEELGAEVSWDSESGTVTGTKGDRTVQVTVGSHVMYVNHAKYTLDTAPMILGGRTLVPIRAIAEGMGSEVEWDSKRSVVSITPKVFQWSDWMESLPDSVTDDLYYTEKETEYRYRTRELKYFTTSSYFPQSSNFVRTETTYGNWSDWKDGSIDSSDFLQVETRTQSSPKKYHYAHWCTGNESDSSIRYKTSDGKFCDEAVYHSLGWYDSQLALADDGVGSVVYNNDGTKYRCSNSCYRWYIVETQGGTYTQYRCRKIENQYVYRMWDDWGQWSEWQSRNPYDDYRDDGGVEVESRTVYRYKEKG